VSSVPVPNPAAPYRPTAPPAPLRVPPAPRRVSGPARRPAVETVPRSRLSAALYRTYAIDLATLARRLGATEAPPACVALRGRLTTLAAKLHC